LPSTVVPSSFSLLEVFVVVTPLKIVLALGTGEGEEGRGEEEREEGEEGEEGEEEEERRKRRKRRERGIGGEEGRREKREKERMGGGRWRMEGGCLLRTFMLFDWSMTKATWGAFLF
jgi:hypothetical protein